MASEKMARSCVKYRRRNM